jgi:hypothetical protein
MALDRRAALRSAQRHGGRNRPQPPRCLAALAQLATVRASVHCGFDPGPVDGIMGRWTRSALQEFERAEGLGETGELRDDVLERLERRGTGA